MKVNELQIGDWVIFHDSGYASDGTTWEENRVCQIDSIDEDVRVKWYDESGCKEDWPHVSTVLLFPIPLTPGILEKNGFKKCTGNEWSVFKYEDDDYTKKALYQVLWSADELYLEIASYTSRTGEFNRMGVEFVHQLQQAMRICGIEKEIEL